MRATGWLLLLACATLLASCATAPVVRQKLGELELAGPAAARVYLYRLHQEEAGFAGPMEFFVNGKPVIVLDPEETTWVDLPRGSYVIGARLRGTMQDRAMPPIDLSVEAGRTYVVAPMRELVIRDLPAWDPSRVGVAVLTAVLTKGAYVGGMFGAKEVREVGRYWHVTDTEVPEWFVGRMKFAKLVRPPVFTPNH